MEMGELPPDLHRLTCTLRRTLAGARLVETPLPLCPALKLYLLDPDNMQRPFSTDEIQAVLNDTPYWVFCWPGGQALAHYILQNRQDFAGKCIVDFGAGSGVVAIAAALAGAARVTACDIDRHALEAVQANAALNGVAVQTCAALVEVADQPDLIIAADVLYDRENRPFLELFLERATEVLVADSRAKTIDVAPYRQIAQVTAATLPDLEDGDEFKTISIYRALAL